MRTAKKFNRSPINVSLPICFHLNREGKMAMTTYYQRSILKIPKPEAESQEKHDAWDPRLDWTITSLLY
jgi:hypothetical protein